MAFRVLCIRILVSCNLVDRYWHFGWSCWLSVCRIENRGTIFLWNVGVLSTKLLQRTRMWLVISLRDSYLMHNGCFVHKLSTCLLDGFVKMTSLPQMIQSLLSLTWRSVFSAFIFCEHSADSLFYCRVIGNMSVPEDATWSPRLERNMQDAWCCVAAACNWCVLILTDPMHFGHQHCTNYLILFWEGYMTNSN